MSRKWRILVPVLLLVFTMLYLSVQMSKTASTKNTEPALTRTQYNSFVKSASNSSTIATGENSFVKSTTSTIATGENSFVKSTSTIVTAFFPLRSKHKLEDYRKWYANFLSLQDTMVIFTTPEMVDVFKGLRTNAKNRTFFVPIQLNETRVAQIYDLKFWEHQFDMDTEKRIHKSYQLFQVWLSKSYFVVEAIKINPFQSQVFVWSDIGCFRSQPRYNQLVIHPEIVPEASILLMAAGPGSD